MGMELHANHGGHGEDPDDVGGKNALGLSLEVDKVLPGMDALA
jgi:hypothetical protein